MHSPQPTPLNDELTPTPQLEDNIAERGNIIDIGPPTPQPLRIDRLRVVAQVELLFWVLGISVAMVLNALALQREISQSLSFVYILLISFYTFPNAVLVLTLLGIILLYLTFSFVPFTLLLGVIRPRLWRLVSTGPQMEAFGEETRPELSKVIDVQSVMLSRSREVARAASTRPQVLLFIGALIAVGGLVFFVVTLPQEVNPLNPNVRISSESPLIHVQAASEITPAQLAALLPDERKALLHVKTEPEHFVNDVLPRLLMLLFIQVLAGFFLRQYRAGVEDFRYYEAILRRRETEALAYEIYTSHPGDSELKKYVDELLSKQEFGLLAKGQTTMVLEAAKATENELQTTVEKILSKIDIAGLLKRS